MVRFLQQAEELKEILNSGGHIPSGKPKVVKQIRAFVLRELLYTDSLVGSRSLGCGGGAVDNIMLIDLL